MNGGIRILSLIVCSGEIFASLLSFYFDVGALLLILVDGNSLSFEIS